MPGDVEFLDTARRARSPAPSPAAQTRAAAVYVRRAEEALALLPQLNKLSDRAAVCQITETWLALAEAELARRDG